MNKQEKYYDAGKKKSINNRYLFRCIAVLYLIYLVYSLIKTTISGDSSMELWLQILLTAALAAATVVIAILSIRGYLKELAAAEITEEEYYARIKAIEDSGNTSPNSSEETVADAEGESEPAAIEADSSDSDASSVESGSDNSENIADEDSNE